MFFSFSVPYCSTEVGTVNSRVLMLDVSVDWLLLKFDLAEEIRAGVPGCK